MGRQARLRKRQRRAEWRYYLALAYAHQRLRELGKTPCYQPGCANERRDEPRFDGMCESCFRQTRQILDAMRPRQWEPRHLAGNHRPMGVTRYQ